MPKAKHAHTTPPVTAPAQPGTGTGRRSLTAGALAALLAPPAAAVAPPGFSPTLSDVCAEFDRLERLWCDLLWTPDGEEAIGTEAEREAIGREQGPLLNLMCSIPATSPADLAALAVSMLRWDGRKLASVKIDDRRAPWNERMQDALLGNVLDLGGVA